MIKLPPVVAARVRLLATRAALPAWILAALAFIGNAEDMIGGARVVSHSLRSVPGIGWVFSPVGLLLFAVGWLIWLVVRPSGAFEELERLERIRALLREAATAIRKEADADLAAAKKGEFPSGYTFVCAFDMLDDACVASVSVGYRAFTEREERMYKAAGVDRQGIPEAAAYLNRLADHLSVAGIDPGFRLPLSFADWCKGHKANVRPVEWRRTIG
jgi:hypothetical protein